MTFSWMTLLNPPKYFIWDPLCTSVIRLQNVSVCQMYLRMKWILWTSTPGLGNDIVYPVPALLLQKLLYLQIIITEVQQGVAPHLKSSKIKILGSTTLDRYPKESGKLWQQEMERYVDRKQGITLRDLHSNLLSWSRSFSGSYFLSYHYN